MPVRKDRYRALCVRSPGVTTQATDKFRPTRKGTPTDQDGLNQHMGRVDEFFGAGKVVRHRAGNHKGVRSLAPEKSCDVACWRGCAEEPHTDTV